MRNLCTLIFISFIVMGCGSERKQSYDSVSFHSHIIFPFQDEHVHGPTIVELPNGDLLTAWFQGSGERWADDVRIMGARLAKGDTVWSETFLMADIPGFPDINPMMFLDHQNRLWLMWYPVLANLWETSIPMYRISNDYESDGPPVWAWQDLILVKPGDKTERGIQPADRFVAEVKNQLQQYEQYMNESLLPSLPEATQKTLVEGWNAYKIKMDSLSTGRNMIRSGKIGEKNVELGYPLTRRIGWQTKNKPVIIDDRLIVPLYSDGFDCSLFALTDNWGKTWQFSNPVLGGAGIQPTIAIKHDKTLVAYLRDNGPPPKHMQRTVSEDRGLTWTIAKDDILPNPGSGFDMVTLDNGDWLIVYNDTEEGRNSLAVALSTDEGISWLFRKKIEYAEPGDQATASHYPAIIQGKDGQIHVVYSYHLNNRENRKKTIKYASFPLRWVKE